MSRKVLVIGYVWPEPNSSAAGWNMMGLLKLFRNQGANSFDSHALLDCSAKLQLAQPSEQEVS